MFTIQWSSGHGDFRGRGFCRGSGSGETGAQGTPSCPLVLSACVVTHPAGASPICLARPSLRAFAHAVPPCHGQPACGLLESLPHHLYGHPALPATCCCFTSRTHVLHRRSPCAFAGCQPRWGRVSLLSGPPAGPSLCLAHVSCSLNMGPLREANVESLEMEQPAARCRLESGRPQDWGSDPARGGSPCAPSQAPSACWEGQVPSLLTPDSVPGTGWPSPRAP